MSSSQKKVVLVQELSDTQKEQLQARFPEAHVVDCTGDRESIKSEIRDAHMVLGYLRPEEFEQAASLELVQVLSQGVEGMMFPAFRQSSVALCNGKGLWSPAMAELTIALILAFYRRLPDLFRWQQEHVWCPERFGYRSLGGQTVGFIGTGDIAMYTVPLCHAFGARIIGYNQRGDQPDGFEAIYTGAALPTFLEACDVVVSTLPNTPETRHFMDADAFASMKSDAIFINVGRGSTVDEEALVRVMQERRIAGAGLDVTEQEPLPSESPLWDLPNVIITGHTAGLGRENTDEAFELFCDNIQRCIEGRPYRNPVDKSLGY